MRGLVTALAFVRPGLSFLGSGVDTREFLAGFRELRFSPVPETATRRPSVHWLAPSPREGSPGGWRQGRIRDLVRGRGLLRMRGAQRYQPLSRCAPTKTCHVAVEPVTAGRCERFPIPTGRESGRAGPRRHCIRLYRADDSWACATHFGQMNAIGGLRLYCGAASTGA